MRKYIFTLVCTLAVALLSSCKGPYVPEDYVAFLEREDVCMIVGYKDMVDFTKGDLQYSFNPAKHIYRAGVTNTQFDASAGIEVQTVQQYFILQAGEPLGEKDAKVTGSVVLCSPTISSGQRTYKLKEAVILKAEDNKVWVWDPSLHLGMVIRR